MRRFALAALLLPVLPAAQPQVVLFPGQTGAQLRASLRAAYRPAALNGDNDDLYASVDSTRVGGQLGVVCVYTGFFVPFDCNPSCDPSQDVFNNGAGINQEHTWPQSHLNGSGSAIAERDFHHLFPSKVNVNADRGNLPFAEIPDAQTNVWYRDATSQTTPPPLNERDQWSELRTNVSFEPREVHEGTVARALFYVQTMYDEETDDAWFTPQMQTLYAWHRLDPVDQAEYDRTHRAALFQRSASNEPLPNPFVLDSTLVRRAFFTTGTAMEETPPAASALSVPSPNPFLEETRLVLTLARPAAVRVEVVDVLGRRVAVLHDGPAPAGALPLSLGGQSLAPGLYLVRATGAGSVVVRRVVRAGG
ncbi:MAG TPA: endonuclease [Rubricoccaceae bacterium]|nr:endonuclease [Rubricoccaceae bacterium]